jgi:hypothetical protein
VFFGIESEAFEHRDMTAGLSARCFAWSAPAFIRWALQAPAFLGGFYRDNGLFQQKAANVVHHNAARAARTALPTRVQEAVNAAVYAAMPDQMCRLWDETAAPVAVRGAV